MAKKEKEKKVIRMMTKTIKRRGKNQQGIYMEKLVEVSVLGLDLERKVKLVMIQILMMIRRNLEGSR